MYILLLQFVANKETNSFVTSLLPHHRYFFLSNLALSLVFALSSLFPSFSVCLQASTYTFVLSCLSVYFLISFFLSTFLQSLFFLISCPQFMPPYVIVGYIGFAYFFSFSLSLSSSEFSKKSFCCIVFYRLYYEGSHSLLVRPTRSRGQCYKKISKGIKDYAQS